MRKPDPPPAQATYILKHLYNIILVDLMRALTKYLASRTRLSFLVIPGSIRAGMRGRAFKARLPVSVAILLALGGVSSLAQQYYVTQRGDNLYQIAMRNGTTVEALAAANGIAPPFTIHAGTRITLAQPSAPTPRIYIVQPGDNLYRVALENGITTEALAAANGIEPPYIVHEGNWLTVPAPWCPEEEDMSVPAQAEEAEVVDPVPVREPEPEKFPELLSALLTPTPRPKAKTRSAPKPKPKCAFVQRYGDGGFVIPRDVIDTVCIKACHADDPPIPLCIERGY